MKYTSKREDTSKSRKRTARLSTKFFFYWEGKKPKIFQSKLILQLNYVYIIAHWNIARLFRRSINVYQSGEWIWGEIQNSAFVARTWESNGVPVFFPPCSRARARVIYLYVQQYIVCRLHTRTSSPIIPGAKMYSGAVAVDVVVASASIGSIDDATRNAGERARPGLPLRAPGSPGNCLCDSACARRSRTHAYTCTRVYTCCSGAWQKGKTKFILRTPRREAAGRGSLAGFPSVHAQSPYHPLFLVLFGIRVLNPTLSWFSFSEDFLRGG